MDNCVTDNKSFQSELHERAWYLQQKQPEESHNENDLSIKKKKPSAKYDCLSEVLTKSLDDNVVMISIGLFMIGFTLLVISGLVGLVNVVIISIHPTVQEHQIYLESSQFASGSLLAGAIIMVQCLFIAILLVICYTLLKLIISRILDLITCAMKSIKLHLKHYLNNVHLYCKHLNAPKQNMVEMLFIF